MTEFNSGRGGRDDDIVDLEAQPVNATGNSAEGSSRESIKQEPLSGTVTVAHIVYCLHSISILILKVVQNRHDTQVKMTF